MEELIQNIITYVTPTIIGAITTIVIPTIIKNISLKSIQKKIDDIAPIKQNEDILREIKACRREIEEIRGKRR